MSGENKDFEDDELEIGGHPEREIVMKLRGESNELMESLQKLEPYQRLERVFFDRIQDFASKLRKEGSNMIDPWCRQQIRNTLLAWGIFLHSHGEPFGDCTLGDLPTSH